MGIVNCAKFLECQHDVFRVYGLLLFFAAILLVATSITYLISFFKDKLWISLLSLILGILGVLCNLAGTLLFPLMEPGFWVQWLPAVAMTITLSFVISVSLSFSQKST
uniref:Major facilitator superfamily (MFS) profile domain-containing protein n=1 Tax=Mesocestoides corti TaxID=53468 RepID=A0A5K3F733_MESCO